MPCRGCFGPLMARSGRALPGTSLAGGEEELRALAEALPDPAGTFWRYSYAAAPAPGARSRAEEGER